MSQIVINAARTHTELLRIAGPLLTELARGTDSDDKAISLLYVVFLLNESVLELADTPTGAAVMERALHRLANFGLASFALKHGTTHEQGQTTKPH